MEKVINRVFHRLLITCGKPKISAGLCPAISDDDIARIWSAAEGYHCSASAVGYGILILTAWSVCWLHAQTVAIHSDAVFKVSQLSVVQSIRKAKCNRSSITGETVGIGLNCKLRKTA